MGVQQLYSRTNGAYALPFWPSLHRPQVISAFPERGFAARTTAATTGGVCRHDFMKVRVEPARMRQG